MVVEQKRWINVVMDYEHTTRESICAIDWFWP